MVGLATRDGSRPSCVLYNSMKIVLHGFFFFFFPFQVMPRVSPHSNLYLRSPCPGVLYLAYFISLLPVLDNFVE